MGYNIQLNRVNDSARIREGAMVSDLPRGAMFAVYESDRPLTDGDLEFHCTFNYAWYFYQTFEGGDGMKGLNGKTTDEAMPILEAARKKIAVMEDTERKTGKVLSETWGKGCDFDDKSDNYWAVSAKNAGKAVDKLMDFCKLAPGYTFTVFA